MKYLMVLVCNIAFVWFANAQKEIATKSKSFPIAGAKFKAPEAPKPQVPAKASPFEPSSKVDLSSPLFTPSTSFSNEKKSNVMQIGQPSQLDMSAGQHFANPNEGLIDKLNGKNANEVSKNFKLIRGNQDLGTFNTNSGHVNVKYRDFGEVDGDQIRVYVNGEMIESQILLDSYYKGFQINLKTGFNKIEFEALNQGLYGPNTAELKVYDDKGSVVSSNYWNLATGFRATIMVMKN
ncbi:hypothetical protein B0A58_10770 [Flavobacterium branchiophilum NBRC 15030 = ATCC 35035]|uniref:Secreted protein n=1 Tax=Flavobacterium branchiophilum TaxID=55197 RepID=A0A543G524_9FLAO|nr:hypothetical protein [Flavobacterium branchiophilum]OXA74570.1 hypothetical protein B0A58_10770 [Flavobacterium branchiophilum NBRC 15030 = ATCC 35035]TQM41190.1 hypothetical protein BC670_2132 [Flavobacterium branchiophilum]